MVKKTKKRTRTQVDKELWTVFSRYIRIRDSLGNKSPGLAPCFTCPIVKPIKQMQAGHFITRRVPETKYDEFNVHAQCLTGESSLMLDTGKYEPISSIRVGDILSAFDEDSFESKGAVVLSASSFIPEYIYIIEMEDGSSFKCTGDHRVVISDNDNYKWETADNLYNMLQSDTVCNIIGI